MLPTRKSVRVGAEYPVSLAFAIVVVFYAVRRRKVHHRRLCRRERCVRAHARYGKNPSRRRRR